MDRKPPHPLRHQQEQPEAVARFYFVLSSICTTFDYVEDTFALP